MPIKVITFDLDNTLWDVTPALLRAEKAQNEWLIAHRPGTVDTLDHDALFEFRKDVWRRHPELAHHVSRMRQQALFELQLKAGYDETASRSGANEAFEVFIAERHKVVLYEEAVGALEVLASDYTLGALTNGNADIYKTDAAEYFDFAFLAEDVGASKPAPDMFEAAIALCGVSPDSIVHVGDDPSHDVAGARAVGMHTVWMNQHRKPWSGEQPADREIDNLQQLPGAVASLENSKAPSAQ